MNQIARIFERMQEIGDRFGMKPQLPVTPAVGDRNAAPGGRGAGTRHRNATPERGAGLHTNI